MSATTVRRTPTPALPAVAVSMRARKERYVRRLVIIDLCVITAAVFGGYLARFQFATPVGEGLPYAPVSIGLIVVWMLTMRGMRCYDGRVLGYGADEYRRVVGASLRVAGGVAIVGYLADVGIARGFLGLAFLAGIIALPTGRYLARQALHRDRIRGSGWSRRVLVVGDASHVLELIHQLRREPYAGFNVVGACIPETLVAPEPQHLDGAPIVGSFRTIMESAAIVAADTVAVAGAGELTARRLRRLGWQMEGSGIDLVLAPALTDIAGPRIHTQPIAGLPLIHVESPEFTGGRKLLKDFVDRMAAVLALALLAPLFLVIAVAIRVESRGPAFFRQTRVGQGGREFGVFKFRSMVVGADSMRTDLVEHNEGDGLLFKMRRDPRVTRVGRVLRKWSLDELPQLINVLIGDMSLVGPRPPLPTEVALYDPDVARRLLVKPGMTGLWQVSGRSDLSWDDGIRLDLYYVENWSLAVDVAILWKTIGAVLRGHGAY
jgi:exopolysaccharide biosynthesis polyprenyl glycosylphosphotransferase